MGRAMELISGRATAPGATLTATTMALGNSLTIRNAPLDSDIRLLQLWADYQAAGTLRVHSPKLHDNVQGIRFGIPASDASPLLPFGVSQKLIAQDTLSVEQTGSAVGGDIEQWAGLIYYGNLPGSDARLTTVEDVMRRGVNLVNIENTITTGAGGGYTGEESIAAEFDLTKANTDYALIGYVCTVECCAIRWRGADLANLGVGGPGHETLRHITSQWFMMLSEEFGLPLIPVINSANKFGISIDAVQDENAAAVLVNTILVELGGSAGAAPAR